MKMFHLQMRTQVTALEKVSYIIVWECLKFYVYLKFLCDIPNFVAKFGSSSRSFKVHFRMRKPVCKQRPELKELTLT